MKSKLQTIRENLIKGTDYVSTNDLAYYLGYKGDDFYNSDHYKIIKELIIRRPKNDDNKKITSSKDSFEMLQDLSHLDVEEFHVLLLNQGNRIISRQRISRGGMTSCVVDLRVLAELSLRNKATQVIVCHNHPSGNLNPSQADKILTEKIKSGLKLLDINLLDHIIIGGGENYGGYNYYSFADEGTL